LLNDFIQESANYQASSLGLVDASSLKIEQLLVIEATASASVTSTLDFSGFDFKVWH
jgi:hypothetical protein